MTHSPDPRPYLCQIPVITDARGNIAVAEVGPTVPFTPQRYFVIYNVPPGETRGEHAHRNCHQLLVCLRGSVLVLTDDGVTREERWLNGPQTGLYVPPMVWGRQSQFTNDALLLVLASHLYDRGEYIEDYEVFLRIVRRAGAG